MTENRVMRLKVCPVVGEFERVVWCFLDAVLRNPPGWEAGIYLAGFFVLLAVAGLNIWKLWKSGTFPTPSPFPNFDYRYLQEKYGTSFSEVRQKVSAPAVFSCPVISWRGLTFDPLSRSEWQPTTIGEPPLRPAANPAWPCVTLQTPSGTWVTWSWWAESWIPLGWPSLTVLFPPTRSAPSPPSPTILATTSPWASWRSTWSSSHPDTPAKGPDCCTSLCTRAKTCWKRRRETSPAASLEFLWVLKRST